MGYREALEAAGAVVHVFEESGDYQGSWWARVTYMGEDRWVSGDYGSCSGCDAFEAEFDSCDSETPEKLAEFGRQYLDGENYTQEEAEAYAAQHKDWDWGSEKLLAFLRAHAISQG